MVALTNNEKISKLLYFLSKLLLKIKGHEKQAKAYSDAARQIQKVQKDVSTIKSYGDLKRMPFIGEVIAKNIVLYNITGRFPYLSKVLYSADPIDVLLLSDEITLDKAKEIIDFFVIDTYADLLKVFSRGKLKLVFRDESKVYKSIEEVFDILPHSMRNKTKTGYSNRDFFPTVSDLLTYDKIFREQNPFSKVKFQSIDYNTIWGVLTFSYSNSENAINSKNVGDWVNIRTEDKKGHSSWVILTSRFGKAKGKRIVMGEALNSLNYYNDLIDSEYAG